MHDSGRPGSAQGSRHVSLWLWQNQSWRGLMVPLVICYVPDRRSTGQTCSASLGSWSGTSTTSASTSSRRASEETTSSSSWR